MPPINIQRLADAGEFAAATLIERFDTMLGRGWPEHKDVRLRSFLALVEELVRSDSVKDADWDEVARQINTHGVGEPERELAVHALAQMRELGQHFKDSHTTLVESAPKPRPQLKISPRI